jgi:hypothetical protein
VLLSAFFRYDKYGVYDSYTLPDNVENLTLTGDRVQNVAGNELDNLIINTNSEFRAGQVFSDSIQHFLSGLPLLLSYRIPDLW